LANRRLSALSIPTPARHATLVEPYAIVPAGGPRGVRRNGPAKPLRKVSDLCYDTGSGGDRDPELVLANFKYPSRQQGERSSTSGPITGRRTTARKRLTTCFRRFRPSALWYSAKGEDTFPHQPQDFSNCKIRRCSWCIPDRRAVAHREHHCGDPRLSYPSATLSRQGESTASRLRIRSGPIVS